MIQGLNLNQNLLKKVQEAYKIAKKYNISSLDDLKAAVLDFGGSEAVKAGLKSLENSKISSSLSKFIDVNNLQKLGKAVIENDKSLEHYRERLKKL